MKLRHTIIIRLVVISIIVLAIFWLSTSILIDKGIDMGRTNQFVDTAMTGSVIISSDLDHFSEITRDRALRPETQEFLKIGNASLQADYLRTLDEAVVAGHPVGGQHVGGVHLDHAAHAAVDHVLARVPAVAAPLVVGDDAAVGADGAVVVGRR